MKPIHFKRARKYVGKRWYYRLRVWHSRKMYTLWDKALIACKNEEIPFYCHELEKYARKEAYYHNKLNSISPDKEREP